MSDKSDARKLACLDDWQLEHPDQDLCGRTLNFVDGRAVGVIEDMLADTEQKRIVAVRLDDRRVVNIDAVDIREGCPVLIIDPAQIPAAPSGLTRRDITSQHVPIVEERLIVGKREAELGRVRIKARVLSDEVHEDVTLREEM